MSGTGTGKTVAIRDICKKVLWGTLRIGVVTREQPINEETRNCNVLVVTPGVALNWLKGKGITDRDLLVVDEIHQTSEHVEFVLALAKFRGCTVVWLSATVDATVYAEYFASRAVIRCEAFDPAKRAKAFAVNAKATDFLEAKLPGFMAAGRGVAVFVPTRAMAERLSYEFAGGGFHSDFFHGGVAADKLEPYLTGKITGPFVVFMTMAGASSLNIQGLDTVVIVDQGYMETLTGSVLALEKSPLGNNELLQMGGRVNGRVAGGEIYLLTWRRDLDFHALKPVLPKFMLGGDMPRVALTCARVGVDARDLDLIGGLDHAAYDAEVDRFVARGLIRLVGSGLIDPGAEGIALTDYGARIERLPIPPAWGELAVQAFGMKDRDLIRILAVVGSVQRLHDLANPEFWDRAGVEVAGSDHLTAYNIVATALERFGYIRSSSDGEKEYGLRSDSFNEWCREHAYTGKAIQEVVLALRSVFKMLDMDLPQPQSFRAVPAGSDLHLDFLRLLAKWQTLDFVQDGKSAAAAAKGTDERVEASERAVARAGQTLGCLRYRRAGGRLFPEIEGTEIPTDLVRRFARGKEARRLLGITADGERYRVEFEGTFAGEPLAPFVLELPPHEVPAGFRGQLPALFARWFAAQMLGDLAAAA